MKRTMMKGKGKVMTVADLRVLVEAMAGVPEDYEVMIACEEMDLALVSTASIELVENTSDDGVGSVLLEFKEPEYNWFTGEVPPVEHTIRRTYLRTLRKD